MVRGRAAGCNGKRLISYARQDETKDTGGRYLPRAINCKPKAKNVLISYLVIPWCFPSPAMDLQGSVTICIISISQVVMWCRKRDSNPRPHHYEARNRGVPGVHSCSLRSTEMH